MPDSADLDARLAERGFRPIAEAPNPIDPERHFLLRLGPGVYAVGYQCIDKVWLDALYREPIKPTHFMLLPPD